MGLVCQDCNHSGEFEFRASYDATFYGTCVREGILDSDGDEIHSEQVDCHVGSPDEWDNEDIEKYVCPNCGSNNVVFEEEYYNNMTASVGNVKLKQVGKITNLKKKYGVIKDG